MEWRNRHGKGAGPLRPLRAAGAAAGALTARLYGEGPDRTPRTEPVDLQLVLEQSAGAPDILVVTLRYVASQDPDFETWFGGLYNVQTPYIRYGA